MFHTTTHGASTLPALENEALNNNISGIFRPIQYLGSKLRSLDLLLSNTTHLYGPAELVVDCFSGSSVVSQAFATTGAKVLAVDSQHFCQHIASAMLGIARGTSERCAGIASSLAREYSSLKITGTLQELLTQESLILRNGPSAALVDFYSSLPQVWKSPVGQDWFPATAGNVGRQGFNFSPIIASHYAGTYFGINQALFFDYARNQIHELRSGGLIGAWTEHALLTALYSTMSTAVCSAGKHFAQPLASKTTGNPQFRITRLHADRSIDCLEKFSQAAHSIDEAAQPGDVEHAALAAPIASVQSNLIEMRPRLLYADPPYTAQQYSRFYHVLEVAARYEIPELQLVNGKVTTGLYNVNRYKSPYSSKVAAPKAFNDLAGIAREAGASLALSYSASSERSTGNSRMISLPELSKICRYYFGRNVNIVEFAHSYRPFNSDEKNNVHRDDPEILIICEA